MRNLAAVSAVLAVAAAIVMSGLACEPTGPEKGLAPSSAKPVAQPPVKAPVVKAPAEKTPAVKAPAEKTPTASAAPAAAPAVKAVPAVPAAAGAVVKETWDWATPAVELGKKFKGHVGMVMQVGDSTTRNANAQAWGKLFGHSNESGGYSESDKEILTWAHADQPESDKNGWYLAATDVNTDRTSTAAKNLTTAGLLTGGPGELPPLAKLVETYKPQVVVLLVGLIDASKGVKPDEAAANMAKAIDIVTAGGAIPLLITLPPDNTCLANVQAFNAKYLALAAHKNIPILDLYGEVLARQPGQAWVNTLTDSEGRKLSITNASGPATEENFKTGGYLLKSWLVVQKLKEIKSKAIDKK